MDVELTQLASQWEKVGPLKIEVKIETKPLTKNEKCSHASACRKKDLEGPGKALCMVIEEG